MNFKDIIKKSQNNEELLKDELIYLLSFPSDSEEAYLTMAEARRISKELSDNKAEVHAQFAINLAPCPKKCEFCSFSAINRIFKKSEKLSLEQAVSQALLLEKEGVSAVFVMTTAQFDFREFVEIAKEIRNNLKPETLFIANVGDKTLGEAQIMKDIGINGVYHAIRMGEGYQTDLDPARRIESMRNFQEAGLGIGTCVEPVGPEHTNEEIAEKIIFTSSISPAYSGAARRISIPGTEIAKLGMISEMRMAQIVAVTRLGVTRDTVGICTHEPCTVGAAAGANLFWAEVGANPRDVKEHTEEGRGMDIAKCSELFMEADWEIYKGVSRYYN